VSKDGLALRALDGERCRLHPLHIVAQLDDIDRAPGRGRSQVTVLVEATTRVAGTVNEGCAVDDPVDRGAHPVMLAAHEVYRQRPDIQPPPPGRPSAAQAPTAVIEAETIHVHAYSHEVRPYTTTTMCVRRSC
jgi:hypothetical protein